MKNKVKIDLSVDKLKEGNTYNTFIDMCRGLEIKINEIPCVISSEASSRRKKIINKICEYADLTIPDKPNRKNKIVINKVYETQQENDDYTIADLLRMIIRDMINKEYEDNSIIKYHKELTVDIGIMSAAYIKIYNSLYRPIKEREKTLCSYGIDNVNGYAEHCIRKLRTKINNHIKTCCSDIDYKGVTTYKMPINLTDSAYDYEFLNNEDNKKYEEFKVEAREEIDNVWLPIKKAYDATHDDKMKIDYTKIQKIATSKFNKYKKSVDKSHRNMRITEAWVFSINEDFAAEPQIVDAARVNKEILEGFSCLLNLQALKDYITTDEYRDIKAKNDGFFATSGYQCSDKAVRQALTKKDRDRTAAKREVAEESLFLDYSILDIESYILDIEAIILFCQV